ncbi:MAG: ABC transporter ATP-binding protein [Anaerolineaceae bacterium]
MSNASNSENNTNQNKAPSQTKPAQRQGFGGGMGSRFVGGEKPRDFKGTMRQLLGYLGKYKWTIILVLFIAAASTVFSIFGPRTLGKATTALYEGVIRMVRGEGGIDFNEIGTILLRVLALYLSSSVLLLIQGFIMTTIAADITFRFRQEIAHKIHHLPLRYFDHVTHGEVLSRVTTDVDVISQTLKQSLSHIITSIVSVIGILVMMLTINVTLTLIALTIIPLSMLIIRYVISHSQRFFRKQQEYLGHVNGHVEEMYGAHVVLKAFNAEDQSISTMNELNSTLYDTAWKAQLFSTMIRPIMHFIGNVGYVAVAIVGGNQVIQGRLMIGDIQAFIQYMRSFQQPLLEIAYISNILQQTAAAAERVFDFLNEPEEVPDPENPVIPENVQGNVSFDHVRFSYEPGTVVIKDFSVEVDPGQQIAIVGPTGAGKTTLVKLLMRFYELDDGEITIDGTNIIRFRRHDLRGIFGMVLQDTWLFNGTIFDNIRYGREDATYEEVVRAADMAYADHFIRTLPGGYQMVLNEEASNISAGQKQLLTIARAVLADPTILILDEATSSVDTRTEILIQKAMDKLMSGRTSFIIAHRLSTIKNADRILVLRDGDIVEQGKHDELLAKNGFYAELYNSQFALQMEF